MSKTPKNTDIQCHHLSPLASYGIHHPAFPISVNVINSSFQAMQAQNQSHIKLLSLPSPANSASVRSLEGHYHLPHLNCIKSFLTRASHQAS